MIVRLKGIIENGLTECVNWFQFYDSPIKSVRSTSRRNSPLSFNSMIVRLKVIPFKGFAAINLLFQFYDSPIKRVLVAINNGTAYTVSIL